MDAKFHYTYSATEQAEIRQIRDKYCPPAESKLDRLRRLDACATRRAAAAAIGFGILSILVLGLGMSMVMALNLTLPGVIIGMLGLSGTALSCPLYTRLLRRERRRRAPEILRLTDELLQK